MDDWWSLDDEILACLANTALVTPAEIAGKLGIGEGAAASALALLAAEGKVRIRVVELASPLRANRAAAQRGLVGLLLSLSSAVEAAPITVRTPECPIYGVLALRQARRYLVDLELPGLVGMVASIAGKKPPDLRYWIAAGPVPAFVKFEGPFYLNGRLWRIELGSPQWRAR